MCSCLQRAILRLVVAPWNTWVTLVCLLPNSTKVILPLILWGVEWGRFVLYSRFLRVRNLCSDTCPAQVLFRMRCSWAVSSSWEGTNGCQPLKALLEAVSRLMRLPSFNPKRRSWPKYFTYKAGVLFWRPSRRFHIHGNFPILLHINSPQKETVFILAEHKMPVALTFRYLWSKTREDITSASIKYGEKVKSNYGAVDKVNSTSAGNRWSNPKKPVWS